MTRPACSAGPLDRLAQAVLVQGADEVQPALDQPAEAGVLGDLRRAGRHAASTSTGRRRASSASRSRKSRRSRPGRRTARRPPRAWSTASTVPGGGVLGERGQRLQRPWPRASSSTTRWPRRRRAASTPARRIEDLPEPDGPTRATNEPGAEDLQARGHVRVPAEEPLGVVDVVRPESLPRALRGPGRAAAGPGGGGPAAGSTAPGPASPATGRSRAPGPGRRAAGAASAAPRPGRRSGTARGRGAPSGARAAERRAPARAPRASTSRGRPLRSMRVDVHLLGLETQLVSRPASRRAGGQSGRSAKARPRHRARACSSRKATRSLSPTVRSSRARVTCASKSWASTSSGGTART